MLCYRVTSDQVVCPPRVLECSYRAGDVESEEDPVEDELGDGRGHGHAHKPVEHVDEEACGDKDVRQLYYACTQRRGTQVKA